MTQAASNKHLQIFMGICFHYFWINIKQCAFWLLRVFLILNEANLLFKYINHCACSPAVN